jgi:methylated-DNA-protein-cysteine methyltransferase-like protein
MILPISDFTKEVMKYIQRIPKGKVATYKQIAALSGKPQGSRGVAWILHSCSTKYKLPWHRVLNAQGKISFPVKSSNYKKQKMKLEKEGIVFSGENQLSLLKYQWKKRPVPRKKRNDPSMFS